MRGSRLVISLIVVCTMCTGCASVPGAHRRRAERFYEEMRLADTLEITLREKFKMYGKPRSTQEADAVLARLKKVCKRPYIDSKVFIVEQHDYLNACTAGKNIYIGYDLMRMLKSQDELAFVIAHEIAHNDNGHVMKVLRYKSNTSAALLTFKTIFNFAGNVCSFGLIPYNPSFLIRHAISMSPLMLQIATDLANHDYKRSHEFVADRHAVMLMHDAGFDPRGAVTFLRMMQQLEAGKAAGGVLADHPIADKRIDRIEAFMSSL